MPNAYREALRFVVACTAAGAVAGALIAELRSWQFSRYHRRKTPL